MPTAEHQDRIPAPRGVMHCLSPPIWGRAAGGSAGRVTLKDGQQAVGDQVALRGVAVLQSLRGAAAPAAGPLLSLLHRRGIGSGTCAGGARTAPTAEVRGRGLESRVLDTVAALHRTAATRPGRQDSPKYREGGPPRRGQVAAPSPPPEAEGRALPCPGRFGPCPGLTAAPQSPASAVTASRPGSTQRPLPAAARGEAAPAPPAEAQSAARPGAR